MLATFRFLTRVPVPGDASRDLDRIHAAWFPFVGLLLGGILAAADLALAPIPWHVRNALVIAVGLLVTGALHLDALMDATDGLTVSRSEAQTTIRSSVHTAEGVAAGVIAVSLGWLALSQIYDPSRTLWLLLAPVAGRSAIVLGYKSFASRFDVGPVTQSLSKSARGRFSVYSLLSALAVCLVPLDARFSLALGLALVAAGTAAITFRWRTGGLGGDHFGALAVVSETTYLLTASMLVMSTL